MDAAGGHERGRAGGVGGAPLQPGRGHHRRRPARRRCHPGRHRRLPDPGGRRRGGHLPADSAGLGLKSETTYTAAGLLRPTARYRPGAETTVVDGVAVYVAGSGTDYGWWGATEISPTGACAASAGVNQAGALKSLTLPDAGGTRRFESYVRDWAGRVVEATVAGSTTCSTYDGRGRPLTVVYPAHANTNVYPPSVPPAPPNQPDELARTVTYDYAVGGVAGMANDGDPRVSAVTDPAGTVTTTVDLLGRVVEYRDVWAQPGVANSVLPTTYAYDQAGRLVTTDGPGGRRD